MLRRRSVLNVDFLQSMAKMKTDEVC